MRIFTASLATETNTFSPIPTDWESFQSALYAPPGQHPESPTLCSGVIPSLRRYAEKEDFTLIEGLAAWAEPGGYLRSDVYERLRDEILDQLRAALPVSAVVLGLHGAMVARNYDDCEGDLLEKVRALVGPNVIVAASLDPHSHLTKLRVVMADILAAFQEFPHTDFVTRADHVVKLALRAARREIKPRISTFDCRMIDVFPTNQQPMRGFVDRMIALELGKVLSVSFIHGFASADVPELGSQMLAVTDDMQEQGDALCKKLGQEIISFRGKTRMNMTSLQEAVQACQAHLESSVDKPLILADVWDNPGGGVAGDHTELLQALLDAGIDHLGVATLWDPLAVIFTKAAGEGSIMQLRMGGKAGEASHRPIDALVEVRKVTEAGWQNFGDSRVPLGPTALVRLVNTNTDIILNSNRTQTFDPNIFSELGVDPTQKRVILVKSTNHFRAAFAKIAADILYIDIDGPYPSDPRKTRYTKLIREIWPRDGLSTSLPVSDQPT